MAIKFSQFTEKVDSANIDGLAGYFGNQNIRISPSDLISTLSLNASNITTGTLSDARLSSNVALKDIDNNFSVGQTINGNLAVDTDTLFVDATNNRVGIGTTTLNAVSGANPTLTLGGTGISGGLILQNSGTDTGRIYETGNLLTHQGMSGVGQVFYVNASTEAMRIDSSGNVGIGTSNPSAKLDVVGTTELNGDTTINGIVGINQLKTQVFSGSVLAGNAGNTVVQRILQVSHSSAQANMTVKVTLHFGISLGTTSNSSVQIIEGYLTVSDATTLFDSDWTTLGSSAISSNYPTGVVMSGTSVYISSSNTGGTILSFQATVNGTQNPGYRYYWYAKVEYIAGGNAIITP